LDTTVELQGELEFSVETDPEVVITPEGDSVIVPWAVIGWLIVTIPDAEIAPEGDSVKVPPVVGGSVEVRVPRCRNTGRRFRYSSRGSERKGRYGGAWYNNGY